MRPPRRRVVAACQRGRGAWSRLWSAGTAPCLGRTCSRSCTAWAPLHGRCGAGGTSMKTAQPRPRPGLSASGASLAASILCVPSSRCVWARCGARWHREAAYRIGLFVVCRFAYRRQTRLGPSTEDVGQIQSASRSQAAKERRQRKEGRLGRAQLSKNQ